MEEPGTHLLQSVHTSSIGAPTGAPRRASKFLAFRSSSFSTTTNRRSVARAPISPYPCPHRRSIAENVVSRRVSPPNSISNCRWWLQLEIWVVFEFRFIFLYGSGCSLCELFLETILGCYIYVSCLYNVGIGWLWFIWLVCCWWKFWGCTNFWAFGIFLKIMLGLLVYMEAFWIGLGWNEGKDLWYAWSSLEVNGIWFSYPFLKLLFMLFVAWNLSCWGLG